MYASVHRYGAAPEDVPTLVELARLRFVPLITAAHGFRAYYLIETGEGEVTAVSLFDEEDDAEHSIDTVRAWTHEKVLELQPGPPEGLTGTVQIAVTK